MRECDKKISGVLVGITVLLLVGVSTCFIIGEDICKIQKALYIYSHRENGIECKARIPVNACQGQCVTGYSEKTGRSCRACLPTNITLEETEVECHSIEMIMKRKIYMATALNCECMQMNCDEEKQVKWRTLNTRHKYIKCRVCITLFLLYL